MIRSFFERPKRYDLVLFTPVIFLVCVGIVMVFSASGVPAEARLGNEMYYLQRQAVWAAIGLTALLVTAHMPYNRLVKLAPIMLLVAIVSLIVVQIPGIGVTRGGATRWIGLGPMNFQPSGPAKLALIFYLASYYGKRKELHTFMDSIGKPALICAPLCILILIQPDFGTAVAMGALFAIIAFVAGARLHHMMFLALPVLPAIGALIYFAPYRMRRIMSFVHPWDDMSDSGFQIIQSFLAFANGGLLGRGLGDGLQKLYFLPEAHSDFVLALVGEELGFAGLLLVLIAFSIFVVRGLGIALRHGDAQARLLAVGLTSMIGLQALINGMVVSGLLPPKGITLPFVSYGGSSLLVMMTAVGILMNVSSHAPEEVPNA